MIFEIEKPDFLTSYINFLNYFLLGRSFTVEKRCKVDYRNFYHDSKPIFPLYTFLNYLGDRSCGCHNRSCGCHNRYFSVAKLYRYFSISLLYRCQDILSVSISFNFFVDLSNFASAIDDVGNTFSIAAAIHIVGDRYCLIHISN